MLSDNTNTTDETAPTAPEAVAALPESTPLYGHTSEETAYLVEDYPYGRKLRCQIRYWVEKNKRGARSVAQTRNPTTMRWNKPKKSTYSEWGCEMFLNHQGHVKFTTLGVYSDVADFELFLSRFADADLSVVQAVALAKVHHLENTISGAQFWTMNGKRVPKREGEDERDTAELARWNAIWEQVKGYKPAEG